MTLNSDRLRRRLGNDQRARDGFALERLGSLPLDVGFVFATAAAIVTHAVVLWFHMIFVLLALAALVLPFRAFVVRLAVWMSVSTSLVIWAVVSLDMPGEELTELPLLTAVLLLVFLVAQSRARRAADLADANAELSHRNDLEHEELRRQLEQAQRREMIGRASAGLSHDLRNVFSVIRGWADELDAGTPAAEGMACATDRGSAILDELLWLGRQHDSVIRVTDLPSSVQQIEPLLRRMVRRGITLTVDVPNAPANVRIDRVGLSQILMNLVANATDAISGSGTVIVSARRSTSPIDPTTTAEAMSLIVRDDGSGFSRDALARAFEPEFTTKDESHSGLGLSTVWGIVDRCGGSIQIDSSPGAGTTVSIRFPIDEPAPEPDDPFSSVDDLPPRLAVEGLR